MPNLQSVLRQEIRRFARKEVRAGLEGTRKAVAQHRREIAELRRRNTALERTVSYLQSRETKRLKAGPAAAEPPQGTKFSVRSLKAQRRKSGLSQEDYASLVGVSKLTDLQLGEREDQTRRDALGHIGVPPGDRQAGGAEAPGATGGIDRIGSVL